MPRLESLRTHLTVAIKRVDALTEERQPLRVPGLTTELLAVDVQLADAHNVASKTALDLSRELNARGNTTAALNAAVIYGYHERAATVVRENVGKASAVPK